MKTKSILIISFVFYCLSFWGYSVYAETPQARQKLISAIEIGDVNLVKGALREGFSSLDFKIENQTPLVAASRDCREDIIDLLLSRNASVEFGFEHYYGGVYPLSIAIYAGCKESILRKLFSPNLGKKRFVYELDPKKGYSLASLLVSGVSPHKVSVDFFKLVSPYVDFHGVDGMLRALNYRSQPYFEFFLTVGDGPQYHHLNYLINDSSKVRDEYLEQLLSFRAWDPKVNAVCSMNLGESLKGNVAECFFRYNWVRTPEWFFGLFPNTDFEIQFKHGVGWRCEADDFARFQALLSHPQIHLKDPQSVFSTLMITSSDLSQCESTYPYLKSLLDKYKTQLDLNSITVWIDGKDRTVSPAGYLVKKMGPNLYSKMLFQAGADSSAAFVPVIRDLEGTRWLLQQGAKPPMDFLDQVIKTGYVELDYLKFLLAQGLKIQYVSTATELVRIAIRQENWRAYLSLSSLKGSPGLKDAKLLTLLEPLNWDYEFSNSDALYIELGNLLVSLGASAKEVPLSRFCHSLPQLKWIKKLGAVDDKVGLSCQNQGPKEYFAILDAGIGKVNEQLDCASPLSKLLDEKGGVAEFKPFWDGLIKRGANINATLCGRKLLDRYFENLPSAYYALPAIEANKSWNIEGFQFKPVVAKLALNGASEKMVIDLVKKGASPSERYISANKKIEAIPLGFVYSKKWVEFAKVLAAKKVLVEGVEFDYYIDRYQRYGTVLTALAQRSEPTDQEIITIFAKAGLITKYNDLLGENYENKDHFKNSLMLNFPKFPEFLVNILPPKPEELRQLSSDYRQTLLMTYAKRGELAAVKKLVELGSEVNQTDGYYNKTALDIALENNHLEIAKYLMSQGGKRFVGRTP